MSRKTITLPGGVERMIHVLAAQLQINVRDKTRVPMIAVRPVNMPEATLMCYKVTCKGGVGVLEPKWGHPLPLTAGRGFCYLTTTATLICEVEELELVTPPDLSAKRVVKPLDSLTSTYKKSRHRLTLARKKAFISN